MLFIPPEALGSVGILEVFCARGSIYFTTITWFKSVTYLSFVLQGGVILVSHDQYLINMVCKEMWHVSNNTVRILPNGFAEYKKIIQTELGQRGAL